MRAVWYAALMMLVPVAGIACDLCLWLDGAKLNWPQLKQTAGSFWLVVVAGILFAELAGRLVAALRVK
jgi:hypothetical protein